MGKINKKFKPMSCPVCDGMYFSGPFKDTYNEEIKEYLNGEVRCSHCGWIYDLHQAKNPNSKNGFNEMTLTEYRKWFDSKIKENPNYDYDNEHRPEPKPHMCPVCGEYEFPDELSSDICPVCGWEDIGFEETPDQKPNKYMMSYNEKVQWFKEKRKNNPKFRWDNDSE